MQYFTSFLVGSYLSCLIDQIILLFDIFHVIGKQQTRLQLDRINIGPVLAYCWHQAH